MASLRSLKSLLIVDRLSEADEERALLQERLSLFSKTMAILCGAVSGSLQLFFLVTPEGSPQNIIHAQVATLVGISFLVVIALLARRVRATALALGTVDAAIMVGTGVIVGGTATVACTLPEQVYMPFSVGLLICFARVLFIPSTPLRTLVLSSACMFTVTAGDIVAIEIAGTSRLPGPLFMGGGIVLAIAVVALCTVGTIVIYGLRRQVREAQRLGQYTLGAKLGEGGMGVVYEARHALLRRRAAIKLLQAHTVGSEAIERFEREVQLTSELTHPNTIAIFDYGRSADGVFYYAMEYVDGVDLERLVESDGPQPAARVIHVLRQVCDALDEAHHRRLIHRDIKPANIMLCRRGRIADVVKVVDFGLVKEVRRGGSDPQRAVLLGTPAYMAPETIADPDKVGPATDLYALGAVGYFMLTGKMVFEAATLVEICEHHVSTPPPPLSSRTDRFIPAALEQLILRCLRKSSLERPASARALRDALDALPEAGGWTESEALSWWDRFDVRAEQKRDFAHASTVAVTIDVAARTVLAADPSKPFPAFKA